jgi:hypothetical protein
MRESSEVKAWHDHFHAIFESMLIRKAPKAWTAAQQAAEIRVVTFALEGLVAHQFSLDLEVTRQTCDALVSRWVGAGASV